MGLFLWFAWLSFISNILIYCITSLLARLRLSPLLLSWIVVNEKLDREKHKSPRKTLATVVLASCRSFLFAWEFCKCCLLTSKSWHHLCSAIVVGHWEPTTKSRTPSMVFEIHRKSLIQHCERSEQRLHYEWTKVTKRMKKWSILESFWKPEACSQTVLPDRSVLIGQILVENAKIQMWHFE